MEEKEPTIEKYKDKKMKMYAIIGKLLKPEFSSKVVANAITMACGRSFINILLEFYEDECLNENNRYIISELETWKKNMDTRDEIKVWEKLKKNLEEGK